MIVSDITNSVSILLLDSAHNFWKSPELIGYTDEAQQEIYKLKPNAATVTEDSALSIGVKQLLPAGGTHLVDVTRNASGEAISAVDQRDLDRMLPEWPGLSETADIEHYCYDVRNPKVFYVYPPASVGASVEIIYGKNPGRVESDTDTLGLSDEYFGALISYVLFRANTKDSKESSPVRAKSHYQAFLQQMGTYPQAQAEAAAGEPEQGGLR